MNDAGVQFVKLAVIVFEVENPFTPSNVTATGVEIVSVAVPLQSPETVKFVEEPLATKALKADCNGKDSVEATGPNGVLESPPPPPQPPTSMSVSSGPKDLKVFIVYSLDAVDGGLSEVHLELTEWRRNPRNRQDAPSVRYRTQRLTCSRGHVPVDSPFRGPSGTGRCIGQRGRFFHHFHTEFLKRTDAAKRPVRLLGVELHGPCDVDAARACPYRFPCGRL